MLSFASESLAQSTASFPEPAAPPPAPPVPARPVAAPPAPSPAPLPAPSATPTPTPAAPAPSPDTTTDRRYPAVSSEPVSTLPFGAGVALYPPMLPYEPGMPVPPGYRVEHRSANGFIAGGATTLIVSYIAAFAVGANEGFKNGTGWTVVPVIGPWAAIGARGYKCDTNVTPENAVTKTNTCVNGAFNEVQTIAILSADAVVQATGAVLLIIGLASGREELVRSDLKTGVRFSPRSMGNAGFGLGLDGRF